MLMTNDAPNIVKLIKAYESNAGHEVHLIAYLMCGDKLRDDLLLPSDLIISADSLWHRELQKTLSLL